MSNNIIHAYAAMQAGAALEPYQFDAGELQAHQVEVKVEYCGLCHSDISVINNDWKILRVNHSFIEITGYAAKELMGKVPYFFDQTLLNPEFLEQFHQHTAGGSATIGLDGRDVAVDDFADVFQEFLFLFIAIGAESRTGHYQFPAAVPGNQLQRVPAKLQ